jgi:hypothetical protein
MANKVQCLNCGRWAVVKGEDRLVPGPQVNDGRQRADYWPTDAYILDCPACGVREQRIAAAYGYRSAKFWETTAQALRRLRVFQ